MGSANDNDSRLGDSIERTYTSFMVAGISFAVDVVSIKEVVKPKGLLPLKEPLQDVEGFIELHSVCIPVLNTRSILSLESPVADESIMIVNIDGYILGLMVDIDGLMDIFSSISTPKPLKGSAPLKDFVEGTLKISDKTINVLALTSLISSDNRAKLFAVK